jgi:hypothetical protein
MRKFPAFVVPTVLVASTLLAFAFSTDARPVPAHARAIVVSSAEPGVPAWGYVMLDTVSGFDPRKLPGGYVREFHVIPGASLDSVSRVLEEAEQRGAAGCDTVPRFIGRPQVWRVEWYSVATGGTFRRLRETRISLGAIRCRALAHRADPQGMAHTLAQVGVEDLIRLGGPAYAMGPSAPGAGPGAEIHRIGDRAALVADARAASPLRDWNSLALDLCMSAGRPGHAVRLSVAELPASPHDACAAERVPVPASALRRALLAFLPRGPIEIAARRPRERALRDGVCGRYGVVLWDQPRTAPFLVDDAYLTPMEMDSLARDVAAAIAPVAPAAARTLRERLGIVGPPPRLPPLATLAGLPPAGPDPVAITLAPVDGGDVARSITWRLAAVPDSLLSGRPRVVKASTMHALAGVLARAATEDVTGCESIGEDARWATTWVATFVDRGRSPRRIVLRAPITMPSWRVRGRAGEWVMRVPSLAANDEVRSVLTDLTELDATTDASSRLVGEDAAAR